MAWIEFHQSLISHPKTKRLARRLGLPIPAIIGHLACFWCWCLEYAQDGNLSRYDAEELADAAMYQGEDSEGFVAALIDAGFLEKVDGLQVHDWHDYAGRLVERRAANAKRMKAARAKNVQRTCETRAEMCEATQPNPTQPNHVHVGSTAEAADVCAFDDPPPGHTEEEDATLEAKSEALVVVPAGRSVPKPDSDYSPEFKVFWAPYPRKVVKDAAAESYKRARSKGATAEEIQAGLVRWLGSVDWADQDLKHLPHASTWLNQRRWKDEPEQATKNGAIPMAADGRPDDLAWERSFVKAYDTDAERIEALVDRARAVQRVVLDKVEAQDVLNTCGLDGAMRWVRDAVRMGVNVRAGVTHG